MRWRNLLSLPLLALAVACGEAVIDPTPDAGFSMDAGACPTNYPELSTGCQSTTCSSTTGQRVMAEATLKPSDGSRFAVVSWVASDSVDNEETQVAYGKAVSGALVGRQKHISRLHERLEALPEAIKQQRQQALTRIQAESFIRNQQQAAGQRPAPNSGTFIKGRTEQYFRERGASPQLKDCMPGPHMCGQDAICVLPEGSNQGKCETMISLKFRDFQTVDGFNEVMATVRKVGSHGAIVTEGAVEASVVDELLKRFEERIAPLDHAAFGEAKDKMGFDRDRNGVVILFITDRVPQVKTGLVGFFQPDDLASGAAAPAYSNGADLLYLAPPNATIDLDSLSGTIAHEYQHLINYYAKVINAESDAETVWFDEGLASFAEDLSGYGKDSFANISAYLMAVSSTSLTGAGIGLEGAPDSLERRGLAHLLARYYFEQKGGATFGSEGGAFTDGGGLAAIKALVQSADSGVDLFENASTGRDYFTWFSDLLMTVAVSGAGYDGLSCNTHYSFLAPETDMYTNYQRGIDLHKDVPGVSGRFNGPATTTFEAETDVPFVVNGGDIRTIDITAETQISISVPADVAEDYNVGFRIVPIQP